MSRCLYLPLEFNTSRLYTQVFINTKNKTKLLSWGKKVIIIVIELPLRYQTVSNLFLWNLSMEQMQQWRVWLFYLWREWKTEVLLPSCLGVRVESHVWSSLMNNPVQFSLSKSNTWSTPWRMLFVNGNCWSQNYCEIRLVWHTLSLFS